MDVCACVCVSVCLAVLQITGLGSLSLKPHLLQINCCTTLLQVARIEIAKAARAAAAGEEGV